MQSFFFMDINPLYSWVCFMFCLGLVAAGILVVFRRSEYRQHPSMRYLQYYLILMYTFGFYALWSQVLLRGLFLTVINTANLPALSRFLLIISAPFLLAGKGMLIFWTLHILKFRSRYLILPLLLVLILVSVSAYFGFKDQWSVYRIYGGLVVVLMTGIALLLMVGKVKYLDQKSSWIVTGLLLGIGSIHIPLYVGVGQVPGFELAYILLYFLSHSAFVVFFTYKVALPEPKKQQAPMSLAAEQPSFELFVEKYGITPREAEIIREVYQGKTNRQIADQLFVTVQTIKDHTHRIYQKTEVSNRTQLASLVRKFQQKT